MTKHFFELRLNEITLRKMSKEEYYKTKSWLRKIRRQMITVLPLPQEFEDELNDILIYGCSVRTIEK